MTLRRASLCSILAAMRIGTAVAIFSRGSQMSVLRAVEKASSDVQFGAAATCKRGGERCNLLEPGECCSHDCVASWDEVELVIYSCAPGMASTTAAPSAEPTEPNLPNLDVADDWWN